MVDLYAQYQSIRASVDKNIGMVIKESAFVGGRFVEQFEAEFASYCHSKYAVALNSGTDALFLSLWALGIKAGDEVITSPFSFFATAEVICRLGAKPVFADIDPRSFNINPDSIKQIITRKTKAIIPVHIFGRPAEMLKIKKLAKKYGLAVVEDACQAVGAKYNNHLIGSIGDVGCFSFFPSKNLGAYGDSGAIVTDNDELANKIRKLRNHGSLVKYQNESIGVSSRLDGIQAAVLLAKLPYLNKWNQRRRIIAREYTRLLGDCEEILTPKWDVDRTYSVYHQYTILVKGNCRDGLKEHLSKNGVSTMVYYPTPLHMLVALKDRGYKSGSLPVVEKVCREVLSLPIYPELGFENIAKIARLVKSFVMNNRTR